MKKGILFLLCSIIAIGVSAQKTESVWVEKDIVIDGSDTDWVKAPRFYDSNAGLMYEMRNNEKNLYLLYEIPDRMKQSQLMSGGLWIEFKVKSRPQIKSSISLSTLPPQLMRDLRDKSGQKKFMIANPGEELVSADSVDLVTIYSMVANQALVMGFRKTPNVINIKDEDQNGFTYAVGLNKYQHLILEIQIPLDEFFTEKTPFENRLESLFTIKTTLRAIERPSMRAGGQPEPGGMDAGRMAGGGGGRGGRGGGGGGGGRGESMGGPGNMDGGNSGMQQGGQRQSMETDQVFKFSAYLTSGK